MKKFERARELKNHIKDIRRAYTAELDAKDEVCDCECVHN